MSPKNYDIYAIFNAAVEQESNDDRAKYLDEACGGDTEIRAEVESLLRAHLDAGNFLGGETSEVADTVDIAPSDEKPGMMIGRYKLIHEISHGGMGVVYMAVQQEPVKRKVALKIIKPGMDTREVVARFNAERQALAMMDHRCVAHVLDGGSTESGRPYFVMELVDGTPITEYCDECRFTTRQRLALFIQVCHAVQHAHLKGVIHRDIKPSNILVTHEDGSPLPKVIDFGIAKAVHQPLTDTSVHTNVQQMVGTPLYMSPEQAERTAEDVDTRTDVYSLGVLLYELLTGTTPFDKERLKNSGLDEVKRIIREEEPLRPSTKLSALGDTKIGLDTLTENRQTDRRTLIKELAGELDWIVMKALEKDRTRRYESASDLGKDVQRFLEDAPVEACPPSRIYRIGKFLRRNRRIASLVTAAVIALVVGSGIAASQAIRATRAERHLQEQLQIASDQRRLARSQRQLALKQKQLAEEAGERERQLAEKALDQQVVAERLQKQAEATLLLALQDFTPVGATFGSDGDFYVASHETNRILRFDGSTGEFSGEFVSAGVGGLNRPEELVFGPDRDGDDVPDLYVANAGTDAVLCFAGETGEFLGIHVSSGDGGLKHPTGLTFGPRDRLYVASFSNDSILQYDARTGKFLRPLVAFGRGGLKRPQTIRFGPDGDLYVTSCLSDSVLRYQGTTGECMGHFVAPGSGGLKHPEGFTFGPDGCLYVLSETGVLRYDGTTGEFIGEFVAQGAGGLAGGQMPIFGPDGCLYVTCFSSESIPRYDGETGKFIDMFVTYDRSYLVGRSIDGASASRGLVAIYLRKAVREAKMGNRAAVQHNFNQAVALSAEAPKPSSKVFRDIATQYDYQRDYDNALLYIDQAIRLDPNYSEAYEHRGRIRLQRAQFELAASDFKQAIRFGPAYTSSYMHLGHACAENGSFTPAVQNFVRAKEREPENALYYRYYALALAGAGDIEGYKASCRQMVERFGRSDLPEVALWLAWSCALVPDAVADFSPVVSAAEFAVRNAPDSIIYLNTLGAIHYRAGRLPEAVAHLNRVNDTKEKSEDASELLPTITWYLLSMAYHRAGCEVEARRWFDKAAGGENRFPVDYGTETGEVPWTRRLALRLLREEAETLIGK